MGCTASLAFVHKKSLSLKAEKRVFFDRFREPDITISDKEKYIIKSQWKTLSTDIIGTGSAVFLRLFKQYPEIKQVFHCDEVEDECLPRNGEFKQHAIRFMQAVGTAVESIDDLETSMSNSLLALGKKHFNFTGFKPAYFEAFHDAILTVWTDVLGSSYTSECADAWSHVFVFILEKLKKGYHLASIETVTAGALAKETVKENNS